MLASWAVTLCYGGHSSSSSSLIDVDGDDSDGAQGSSRSSVTRSFRTAMSRKVTTRDVGYTAILSLRERRKADLRSCIVIEKPFRLITNSTYDNLSPCWSSS